VLTAGEGKRLRNPADGASALQIVKLLSRTSVRDPAERTKRQNIGNAQASDTLSKGTPESDIQITFVTGKP
jgi:hypothetical protein